MSDGTLQMYGQWQWHDDAEIVGDKAALEKLKNAIEQAIEHGEKEQSSFFPTMAKATRSRFRARPI